MKATLQYYPMVLFIMLFKVLPFFDSMDKVLLLKFSESYCEILKSSLNKKFRGCAGERLPWENGV